MHCEIYDLFFRVALVLDEFDMVNFFSLNFSIKTMKSLTCFHSLLINIITIDLSAAKSIVSISNGLQNRHRPYLSRSMRYRRDAVAVGLGQGQART